jgi:hypothetical protein
MLIILTKPCGIHPFNSEWVKYYAGKITGKKRGPEMVALSLSRGLDELGVPHLLNPFFVPHSMPHQKEKDFTLHVVSGARTLEWALRMKKAGKIEKLIAGPAISVVPADHNSILNNPLIDKIVFPGQWTKDFFSSIDPYFKNKIEVWPAGVRSDVTTSSRNNGSGIIYCKSVTPEIRQTVTHELDAQKIKYVVFGYGNFRQADYFSALEKADWMIYLSPSESQGIALQEAWIRDVPTLVWNPGSWNYQSPKNSKKYSWSDSRISAPYLNAESGQAFGSASDFKYSFGVFLQKLASFTPRAYCMESLTDIKSAERFLEIIGQK